MKQKDITLIAVVVIVSGILSFALSKIVISSPNSRKEKVEIVDKITADFPAPDKKYFNENAIDPTKLIKIGDNTNPAPFKN